MKYVILVRVSSKKQEKEGSSLDIQQEACLQLLENIDPGAKYIVVKEVCKGWKDLTRRPKLMEAISQLKRGDVLLTYKPDRFARSDSTVYQVMELVKAKRASILFADGTPSDEKTLENLIMFRTKSMISAVESKVIGNRLRDTYRKKYFLREAMGNMPYGFIQIGRAAKYPDGTRVAARIEPDPKEQQVLAVMRKCQDSGMSLRSIAKHLNSKGLYKRDGNEWHYQGIYRILKSENPLYRTNDTTSTNLCRPGVKT